MKKYQNLIKSLVFWGLLTSIFLWDCSTRILLKQTDLLPAERLVHQYSSHSLNINTTLISLFEYVEHLARDSGQLHLPICSRKRQGDTTEKKHFMYLQTDKGANNGLQSMFRRFALVRDLSVVLPVRHKLSLGWPYSLQPHMHRPSLRTVDSTQQFDVLVDHVMYDYSILKSLLPNDAVYIASIKEPFENLKSALHFFQFDKRTFLDGNKTCMVNDFLDDMEGLDALYKQMDHIDLAFLRCVPPGVSITQNFMSFSLGFANGFHPRTEDQTRNYGYIKKWLADIKLQFPVVIIVEYLPESMIMLKRYMCWGWKDIVYKISAATPLGTACAKQTYREDQVYKYKHNWSFIDTVLYKLFNATLWNRINTIPDFDGELQEFKIHLAKVNSYCNRIGRIHKSLHFLKNDWDPGYTLTPRDCHLIFDKDQMQDDLKETYDIINKTMQVEEREITFIKWWC